jgi:CBS domain-containing protein
MATQLVTLDVGMTVAGALEKISGLQFSAFPVVDEGNVLRGVMTEGRLRRLDAEGRGADQVAEHVRLREYAREGQTLHEVLGAMQRLGVRQLCVIDDAGLRHVVGIIAMGDVVRAMLRAEERNAPDAPPSSRGASITPPSPSLPRLSGPPGNP